MPYFPTTVIDTIIRVKQKFMPRISMEHLRKITNMDKVTLALLLEEGKARVEDLQFHLTLTKYQIVVALSQLVAKGSVIYENTTSTYRLL